MKTLLFPAPNPLNTLFQVASRHPILLVNEQRRDEPADYHDLVRRLPACTVFVKKSPLRRRLTARAGGPIFGASKTKVDLLG
jgi:hypothetical protein